MRPKLEYCPVCGQQAFLGNYRQGWQKHCVQLARNEAFKVATGRAKEAPHLEFYKNYTENRVWNNKKIDTIKPWQKSQKK